MVTVTNNSKSAVRLLANLCKLDNRTVFGSNLRNISRDCQTDIKSLTPATVKSNMKYFPVPDEEQWRIPLLSNLVSIRTEDLLIENFENTELDNIIEYVCTT